jgi:ferredoxin
MTAGIRLRLDPIACDGRKLCAEILPERITPDDWASRSFAALMYPTTSSTKPAKPSGSAPN